MNPIERRKVRKKGSELGTAFLIVCTLFVALFAFAFSSQLTAGIVIACCGIGVMILAAIYHIGERLDLILEELQNGNEARETARIEAKTVNQRSTASEEPVSR
jgi:di/tricarboxylate transporter